MSSLKDRNEMPRRAPKQSRPDMFIVGLWAFAAMVVVSFWIAVWFAPVIPARCERIGDTIAIAGRCS